MSRTVKMTCEKVSGGWGALCRGTGEFKGMPKQEMTFLYAWDMATGEAHMFEVASTGEVHNHVGKLLDGGKGVSLIHEGKNLEGKVEKDDCTMTWPSPKEKKIACAGTQAGATVWTFGASCKKG